MSSSRPNYAAMTVNERLFVAGLFDDFYSAIDAGKRQAAIDLLGEVDLDPAQAVKTATLCSAGLRPQASPHDGTRARLFRQPLGRRIREREFDRATADSSRAAH